ncbi:hypothetical protein AL051_02830 [Pseudomonas amygdali pv. dendropanacis]|nr:hypothetical protein AL051_02830 [Pseudomonas amygdali pv. dendropanacis]
MDKNAHIDSINSALSQTAPFPLHLDHLKTDIYHGMSFARIGPKTVICRGPDRVIYFEDDDWYLVHFAYSVVDNPREGLK